MLLLSDILENPQKLFGDFQAVHYRTQYAFLMLCLEQHQLKEKIYQHHSDPTTCEALLSIADDARSIMKAAKQEGTLYRFHAFDLFDNETRKNLDYFLPLLDFFYLIFCQEIEKKRYEYQLDEAQKKGELPKIDWDETIYRIGWGTGEIYHTASGLKRGQAIERLQNIARK